jgi:hypothetical protein
MYAALYRGQRLINTVCLYQNPVVSLSTGINICPTREITASSGNLTSPNYPNKYPPNTDCTLTIKQPLDTKFVFNLTNIDLGGKGNLKTIGLIEHIIISLMEIPLALFYSV